ncbi:uncharacterized protein LOC107810989 isoform X1 [Nicotiana tabacum]|uniref:Uncharacterized protein LOC107810989 isoform X1 n=2 Tax=Nicotiana tabacum TaxID=4097 RepID=A0AC58UEV3_TOBAC
MTEDALLFRSSIDHPPIQTLGLKSIIRCAGYMSGVIYCYVRNRSTGQRKTILLQENGLRGNQLDQSKRVYLLHGNIKANMCTSCMEALRVEYDIVGPDEDTQITHDVSEAKNLISQVSLLEVKKRKFIRRYVCINLVKKNA